MCAHSILQNYGILGCLREQYEDLGAACKEEVFKRQAEAANDWRTDKELNEACKVRSPSCKRCLGSRMRISATSRSTIAPHAQQRAALYWAEAEELGVILSAAVSELASRRKQLGIALDCSQECVEGSDFMLWEIDKRGAGGCDDELPKRKAGGRGGAGVPGGAPPAAVLGLPGAAVPAGGRERRGPAPVRAPVPRLPGRQEEGAWAPA